MYVHMYVCYLFLIFFLLLLSQKLAYQMVFIEMLNILGTLLTIISFKLLAKEGIIVFSSLS